MGCALLAGEIVALDGRVLYCTVLYCTVLYCTVLYCTVLYYTVLYCTVLYCTVLYCTVLHCMYYTKGSVLHGLANSCPLSCIQKLETHLVPARTGQAACRVMSSPSPLRWRLYQKAAAPRSGHS